MWVLSRTNITPSHSTLTPILKHTHINIVHKIRLPHIIFISIKAANNHTSPPVPASRKPPAFRFVLGRLTCARKRPLESINRVDTSRVYRTVTAASLNIYRETQK